MENKESPSNRDAQSPERRLRLEEKERLSELNKLLEAYILEIRKIEASTTEKSQDNHTILTREYAQRVTSEYEQKICKMADEHSRSMVEIQDLNRRLAREQQKNSDLLNNVKQLEKSKEEMLAKIAKLSHDLDIQGSRINRDDNLIKSIQAQLEALKEKEAAVTQELETLRQRNILLETSAMKESELRLAIERDLQQAQQNFETERKRFQEELLQLSHNADEIERSIRQELSEQLKQHLLVEHEKVVKEKNEVLRRQLDDFDAQLEEIQAREQSLIKERDELQFNIEKLRASRFTHEKEKNTYERKIRDLERQIFEVTEEYSLISANNERIVGEKNAEISRLVSSLRKVQEERNVLFGLGVGLVRSIESYETILATEERKPGVSPKRQKTTSSVSPTKKQAPLTPDSGLKKKEDAGTPTQSLAISNSDSQTPTSGTKRKANHIE